MAVNSLSQAKFTTTTALFIACRSDKALLTLDDHKPVLLFPSLCVNGFQTAIKSKDKTLEVLLKLCGDKG